MGILFYYLVTVFVLITMFSVLVAAHELGHYLFARLFNMGVEEFSIGFGKPQVWTWMRRKYRIPVREGEVADIPHTDGGRFDLESSSRPSEDIQIIDTPNGQVLEETTRFTIRPWPLGGFVRIKGMIPEEDGSEVKIAGGFYSKPPWQRLIVLFAGPAFSVIAGLAVLIPVIFVDGIHKPIYTPVMGIIDPGGPADKAGLKEGDYVKSIDGKPIKTFYELNVIVRDSPGKKLQFDVLRGSQELTLSVVPQLEDSPSSVIGPDLKPTKDTRKQAKLRTGFPFTRESIGLLAATSEAVSVPIDAVANLLGVVRHPSTFKDNVSGPVTITRFTYDTVKMGIASILRLAALLSISVGVFNLLPVAPLDGGQIAMAVAEIFRRGRRLSIQVQGMFNAVGLMCMLALVVCVLFVDFGRLASGNSVLKDAASKKATK